MQSTLPKNLLIESPMLFCMVRITECSLRTTRRQQSDVKSVLETLNGIKVQLNSDHIIACFRLEKFKQNQPRPRPILIKLQCTMDVNSILANNSSSLVIKPDTSLQERETELALLKERWSLIKGGLDHKQIRLSNSHIYINNRLHGEVVIAVLHDLLWLQLHLLNLWTQHTCNNRNHRSSPPDDCPAISNYVALNSKNSNFAKLKILSLNCCSSGKRAQFQTFIDEHNPDIICGCESHLDSSYFNSENFLLHIHAASRKDQVGSAEGVFLCIKVLRKT